MKKVVLLGDSIRLIGYGTKLPEITQGEFEIWQPDDNSRFVQYILRQIFDYSSPKMTLKYLGIDKEIK